MRPVFVTAVGVFAPADGATGAGAHEVPGFDPKQHLPDKKHARLMSRSVQLGVAALKSALLARPGWESVPPERRGMFVGTTPGGGDPADLMPALDAARIDGEFSMAAFGAKGIPLVPPLWLVRGLSNNVVGYGSAYFEVRGPNATHCDGRHASLAAFVDGYRAVAENRADLVLAGGADCVTHAGSWLPIGAGEGSAFLVLEPAGDGPQIVDAGTGFRPGAKIEVPDVEVGAVTGLLDLALKIRRGDKMIRVEALDAAGGAAWVSVASML